VYQPTPSLVAEIAEARRLLDNEYAYGADIAKVLRLRLRIMRLNNRRLFDWRVPGNWARLAASLVVIGVLWRMLVAIAA
jgi:hypothetical protein